MNIHVSIMDIHIRARTLDAARPGDGPIVLYDIQQSPDVSSVRVLEGIFTFGHTVFFDIHIHRS